MVEINKKLVAVEAYFENIGQVCALAGVTGELSYCGPLTNLLNAVGEVLNRKVFCVSQLAKKGAGHPGFGLYATHFLETHLTSREILRAHRQQSLAIGTIVELY